MTGERIVVAIDGPAGAGKTAVSKMVAQRLGYPQIGTGALYRAVAVAAERLGLSWDDEQRVGVLAHELAKLGAIELVSDAEGGQTVSLYGEDITALVASERIGGGASRVSALRGVRAALLELQRHAAREGGAVLEGRDIGTVVFPDAEAKFFLTASIEQRVERRYRQLVAQGVECDLEAVRADVIARDERDRTRSIAPLDPAPDALVIDSSEMSVEQVVSLIVERVREVERSLGTSR